MKRTNFRKIIRTLKEDGYTNALLAHECRCSESHIQQLSRGSRKAPSYDIGKRLVELLEDDR